MPKLEFPKFDGENPRLWRDRCVMFFEVYGVHPTMMTRFAALNFQGSAVTWLQTVQRRGRVTDWQQLCDLVFERFDKDQYKTQLKQLETLHQTGTVAEYQEQFEKLAHEILLYNTASDDVYFVTRFMTGLKEEIRAPIALHRPKDVVTASALATLQEEELSLAKNRYLRRGFTKGPDRASTSKQMDKPPKAEFDDKLYTLKQFRRKNGICFKCGGKWSTTHTCPDQVPLHVLEELWDALDLRSSDDPDEVQSKLMNNEDSVMAVQTPEEMRHYRRQTLKLLAQIGNQQVLVLVDSGSIGTLSVIDWFMC